MILIPIDSHNPDTTHGACPTMDAGACVHMVAPNARSTTQLLRSQRHARPVTCHSACSGGALVAAASVHYQPGQQQRNHAHRSTAQPTHPATTPGRHARLRPATATSAINSPGYHDGSLNDEQQAAATCTIAPGQAVRHACYMVLSATHMRLPFCCIPLVV